MPELPEVETTKEGIKTHIEGQTIANVIVRNYQFRLPVPENLHDLCAGKQIIRVKRRAKYIVIELSQGHLLIHLGMSGHLRITSSVTELAKHDHVMITFANQQSLRFCDPRRFGLFIYLEHNPNEHALLKDLGPEPLSENFDEHYLWQQIQGRKKPIKSLIMDNKIVVGVGNIYATESLFLANIHPNLPGNHLALPAVKQLVFHIKNVLEQAIACGGTTLRDFYSSSGKPGYFYRSLQAYGRKNQPCLQCNCFIESIIIGGRNSYFCPNCQNMSKHQL